MKERKIQVKLKDDDWKAFTILKCMLNLTWRDLLIGGLLHFAKDMSDKEMDYLIARSFKKIRKKLEGE